MYITKEHPGSILDQLELDLAENTINDHVIFALAGLTRGKTFSQNQGVTSRGLWFLAGILNGGILELEKLSLCDISMDTDTAICFAHSLRSNHKLKEP